ncbi:MFS general substrate transporter [Xylaria venustula]|nr:MFS general substrate transporter [Xylaria venustula]
MTLYELSQESKEVTVSELPDSVGSTPGWDLEDAKGSAGLSTDIVKDWSSAAEARVRRKLDFIIVPILMLGLFALQLDKGNISNALTTSFVKDIGITNDEVNHGSNIMSAAIVFFEIPFNMVLSRIGPAKWLIIQVFSWGIIATLQLFIRNLSGFYATRFLLGMWEGGYLAACMTILASFYTRKEMALRVTLVYLGNYFSAGVGNLIAAGIFKIPDGTGGLKSWQWLFLIDGVFSLSVGVLFIFIMPSSPTKTIPLCGIKAFDFFSADDNHVIRSRVILDDPRKTVSLESIGFRRLGQILLTCPTVWGHAAVNVISQASKGGLALYTPTIVKNLGFSSVVANLLASVPNFGTCIYAVIISYISDKTAVRGPLCLLCLTYNLVFAGVQYSVVGSDDIWLKYAILTVFVSGAAVSQGLNDAWFSVNTADPQVRCLGMALAVAGSNLGALSGQNIFVKSDAPHYPNGFRKIIGIYGGSLGVVLVVMGYYWYCNKKLLRELPAEDVIDENGADIVHRHDGQLKVKYQI